MPDKHDRILAGKATIEEVYNEGKDELYKWKRVGDVGQDARMENNLEPAPPRRLASPLLDQYDVATPISDEFRGVLEQTLARLPDVLTQKIKDSDYRLRFGATLLIYDLI